MNLNQVKYLAIGALLIALLGCAGGAGNDTAPDSQPAGGENEPGTETGQYNGGTYTGGAVSPAAVGATVVGVTIEDTSGADQNNVPVTFGQVFKPGEIPAGTLLGLRLANGTQALIPSQIDKKATHADGSLRHAVVTARVPSLIASNPQDIEIVVVDSVPTNQSVQLADLLATNFDGVVSLDVAGTTYTASIADLLNNTQAKTWLSGSEVTEWMVFAPVKAADGTEHPHLTARFNVRAYASFDSVRVDVVIENNWSYVPNPQNFVYDVNVSLCGNNVYSKTGVTHYHHARWRKTFWCGAPPQRHIKHDLDYLLTTGAIPNYDASLVVPESDLQKMQDNWDAKVSNRSGLAINELMGTGFIYENMPGTGSRPDIAFFPRWVVRYLLSNDLRAKRVTLGSADAGAHWPIHYRDKTTGYPVSLVDYPRMTLKGSRQSTYNQNTGLYEEFPECGLNGCDTPYSPDSAHQPALNYVPYLLTGDNYYLEELHFWSNYNLLQANPNYREDTKGLVKWEQVRGQAWSLRTLAHASYITPDNHLLKPYFVERLNNNIAWYNDYYVNNLGDYSKTDYRNALGWIGNVRTVNGFSAKVISFWQNDFMTHVSGELVALGYTDIIPFRNWISTFVGARYLSEPGFCRYDAAEWNSIIQDPDTLLWIDSWTRMQEVNHSERVNNCPVSGSFKSNVKATDGYIAQSRPALATAVDSGYPLAQAAYDYLTQSQATAGADNVKYGSEPTFAILPRN